MTQVLGWIGPKAAGRGAFPAHGVVRARFQMSSATPGGKFFQLSAPAPETGGGQPPFPGSPHGLPGTAPSLQTFDSPSVTRMTP